MALEFPVIFLLRANLDAETIAELEGQIPSLTYDAKEAEVFLGRMTHRGRALLELRKCNIHDTEEVFAEVREDFPLPPEAKRRRISGSQDRAIGSDSETKPEDGGTSMPSASRASGAAGETIKVVKISWFTDSIKSGTILPIKEYLLYEGRRALSSPQLATRPRSQGPDILRRAKADIRSGKFYSPKKTQDRHSSPTIPALLQETTVEHDADPDLPPIPEYLHTRYACQRPTPVNPPNKAFIDELKKIRVVRTLTGDAIGVRSYSSMIASLAAYPHMLSSAKGQ